MNRRKFISRSAMASAAIGATSILPSAIRASVVAPSDTLNVALIGCRNMGFGVLEHHLSNPGVNCVALCDVDENTLNERAKDVLENYNQSPKLFRDFRKVLEQKDIDAVIIGTPDHWHCLMTVYALQAGKDVYTEEYTYTEGRESHGEHAKNFIDCIKSRETPACPPEIGRAAALHVHIANIAGRTGEPVLIWDNSNNRFTNSEAANKLITPVYREPWILPKI